MSAEFLISALIVVLSPGTGVLYTIACGLGRGAGASIAAAFGCTLGIVPSIAASLLGLAAILHTSALAFQALKFAGLAYLLYMAWQTLREGGVLSVKPEREEISARRIATRGAVINILNPKLSLFFLAFLPQFVPAGAADPLQRMAALSAVFMAMTLIVFTLYGLLASTLRRRVIESPSVMKWMRRSFAAAFAGLGLKLALAER